MSVLPEIDGDTMPAGVAFTTNVPPNPGSVTAKVVGVAEGLANAALEVEIASGPGVAVGEVDVLGYQTG